MVEQSLPAGISVVLNSELGYTKAQPPSILRMWTPRHAWHILSRRAEFREGFKWEAMPYPVKRTECFLPGECEAPDVPT